MSSFEDVHGLRYSRSRCARCLGCLFGTGQGFHRRGVWNFSGTHKSVGVLLCHGWNSLGLTLKTIESRQRTRTFPPPHAGKKHLCAGAVSKFLENRDSTEGQAQSEPYRSTPRILPAFPKEIICSLCVSHRNSTTSLRSVEIWLPTWPVLQIWASVSQVWSRVRLALHNP